MIQMRRSSVAVLLVLGLSACGSDGGSSAPSTPFTTAPPDTIAAQRGEGEVVVDGVSHPVTVTSCDLLPSVDPATGVTTVFALEGTSADPATPFALEVTRQQTSGAATTTTDTVTYAPEDGEALQAQRAELNGAFVDLRHPGVGVAMLDIADDGVSGEGEAGPPGSVAGDPGVVTVSLVARCP
jgi:hypothetical protein